MNEDTGRENSQSDIEEKAIKWPKLSPKALYGLAGEFVELATENSEAAPEAVLATFLTRFGVQCGPGPYSMVGDTKHSARIFTVIVGASSKARKGTSAKPVDRLFDFELMNEVCEEGEIIKPAKRSPGPLSSGEGIIYAVRDELEEWKQNRKTGAGEWVITDPGVKDKRLYILDEEFSSALSCTKRDGNTLSPILRSAWDDGDIEPLTKTSRIKTTGAHIGICTHITLEELAQKLSDVEIFNGFSNRFLFCLVRRPKLVPFPRPMPENRLFLIKDKLRQRLRSINRITEMKFGDDAKQYWELIYPDLAKDRHGVVGIVKSRAEAQVKRLSMIYALTDGKMFIKLSHLEAANAFFQYCGQSADYIFKDRESNAIGGKIIALLKKGPASKTDLYRAFKNNISHGQMESTLSSLIECGRISFKKKKTGGKPKMIYTCIY